MKTKHPESEFQRAYVLWFRLQYPKYRRLLLKISNEGKRSKALGGIMRAEGLVCGTPDLFLAMANSERYGLFIEMKAPGGKLSPEQNIQIPILQGENYQVEVCYSLDQFMQIINDYIKDYEK